MKKIVLVSVLLVLSASLVMAMAGPAPKRDATRSPALAEKVFLIDDFESGSIKSPRDWWTFDLEKANAVQNSNYKGGEQAVEAAVGNYSLLLSGAAKSWYAGGCGTYIAKEGQDLSKYNTFQIDVFGNGAGSGTIKVELVDDDNNNWQVEQDAAKNYALLYDDKLVYEIRVDWSGWKRVIVPLADFIDDNPNIGDDVWNPQQANGSGGLVQMQMVCIATTDKGRVNFNVDNVALTVGEK